MAEFESPYDLTRSQDLYSSDEVGLNHPNAPGFIRIRDNGDIEIVAGEGVSILLNGRSRTITFIADHVNFLTRSNGLRWNRSSFNERAVTFNEPTLIVEDDKRARSSIYKDVDYFLDDDMTTFSSTSLAPALSEFLGDEEIEFNFDASDGVADGLGEETEVPDLTQDITSFTLVSDTGKRFRVTVDEDGSLNSQEV